LRFSCRAFDWSLLASRREFNGPESYDVIVIARLGASPALRPSPARIQASLIEQHDKLAEYATAFSRPGGYTLTFPPFTSVAERTEIQSYPGFPEIASVEFVRTHAFAITVPEHEIRVAQRDPKRTLATLIRLFPNEAAGITGLSTTWEPDTKWPPFKRPRASRYERFAWISCISSSTG